MGILRRIKQAFRILTEKDVEQLPTDEKEKYLKMGIEFERYVLHLFPPDEFSIVDYTKDVLKKMDVRVESDLNPDLEVRHIESDTVFFVECKFRSGLYKGNLSWTRESQLERYNDFAFINEIPVFVVIGLGGEPASPKRMFCIPLNEAFLTDLPKYLYETYERKPEIPFSWNDRDLV